MSLPYNVKITKNQKKSCYISCSILSFCLMIADIIILIMHNNDGSRCERELPEWLTINIFLTICTIIASSRWDFMCMCSSFSAIDEISYVRIINVFINIILFLANLIMYFFGWLMVLEPENCKTVMPDVYNMVLAHIIIRTIIIGFSLIICMIFVLIFCITSCIFASKSDEMQWMLASISDPTPTPGISNYGSTV